jgi:hypothetical protein
MDEKHPVPTEIELLKFIRRPDSGRRRLKGLRELGQQALCNNIKVVAPISVPVPITFPSKILENLGK